MGTHICMGKGRKGRGGGGILLFGDGPVEGVVADDGYFLGYFFGLEGRTLCSPFSRGCTVPNLKRGGNGGAA